MTTIYNNNINSKKMSDFMTKIAPFYDSICHPSTKNRKEFLENFIKKKLPIGSYILDSACSTGETLLQIHSDSYHFYGTDLSKGMILIAQQKSIQFNKDIQFHEDNMCYFKKIDNTFDLVYNNSLVWLHSPEELKSCFEATKKILNPNAFFIIDINNPNTFLKTNEHLFTSSHKTEDYEIYKITRYHNVDNRYVATQIYSYFDYKKNKVESYGCIIEWHLFNLEIIQKLLETIGFQIIQVISDYINDENNDCAYYQLICKRKN